MSNKKRIPETRYPYNLEKSYSKRINKMIDALNEMVISEFDKKGDLFEDASLVDQIKTMVKKIKGLSLGIFNEKEVNKVASSHVRSVSSSNKANVNAQTSVSGISPIDAEPWIKDYMTAKTAENVSYITNIRDDYTQKIEQTIYRGITNGDSSGNVREELMKHTGMARNKAKFIARDQTGTLLGQLNAERHIKSGIEAFIWRDSGDAAVRDSHAERNGKLFFYEDNPLLPGADYGCRCIAKPAFEEDIEEAEKNGTAVRGEEKKEELKQEKRYKKLDFTPIKDDNLGSKERITEINNRSKNFIESYKKDTGIDVLELFKSKTFVDRENPYDDEKAKFVQYILNKNRYDQKPKMLKNADGLRELHRGIVDFKDGTVTSDEQINRFKNGTFDISGAKSSTYGRGMYFGADESVAKRYMDKGVNGKSLTVYLDPKANMLQFDDIAAERKVVEEMKDELGDDYVYYKFLLNKNSLMDKQADLFAIMHGYDGVESKSVSVILNRGILGVVE